MHRQPPRWYNPNSPSSTAASLKSCSKQFTSPALVLSCIIDSDSAVLCHSQVIWPFLTHENKLFICLQAVQPFVPIDIQIRAGYSTSCAWTSHKGLAVSDLQRRWDKKKQTKNKPTKLFVGVNSLQSQNYSTENKTDLNCYWVRTPYDSELAAAFYITGKMCK